MILINFQQFMDTISINKTILSGIFRKVGAQTQTVNFIEISFMAKIIIYSAFSDQQWPTEQ
jgi:hypothetical protein